MPRVVRQFPLFMLGLLAATLLAGCKEEGDIRIAALEFEGVVQVDKGALANALVTKRGSRLPWGKKTYFDRAAFDDDLKRVDAFYRDRGFPDARITSFDIDLNDAQDSVKVTVHISEGEPIRVDSIDMTGFDVLSDAQQRSLRGSLPLQPELPLDRQLAVATRDRAVNVLRDEGYPYALVSMRAEDAGPKRQKLVLTATPGPIAYFGAVDVKGQLSVDEDIIRRQLTFKTGDKFTRKAMRDSQRRLYGLELFQFANIESLEERELQITEIPARITVAEAKHRKITTGVGYGSEEKARARVRWDHVNFLGGARHLGVEAKWSSLSRGLRTDYTQPYLFSPNYSLRLDGQLWNASEPVYSLNQAGGRVTVRRQMGNLDFWSASLINEYQKSAIANEALTDFSVRNQLIALGLDPRDGTARGTVSGLAFDIGRNTSGNVLDARSGYSITGHLESAGRFMGGTYNYLMATADARHYLPVAGSVVLANRVTFSAIDPQGDIDANVPFNKRFFLGGASSIRGWGRYEVSPLSPFGFPIGGLSSLQATSEVRMPIRGNLGAVGFLDFGNVWERPWGFELSDMRYAVGSGVRYVTPIGPIRVDVGYQLNPIDNLLVNGQPQSRRFRAHFSIGQAF